MRILLLLILCHTSFACETMSSGSWGKYELAYFNYLKDNKSPESRLEFRRVLSKVADKRRPPPGLCAEYGFLLYQEGDTQQAIKYFAKEKQLWPQSSALMNKIIVQVNNGQPLASIVKQ